jgi:nucleoside-diphosphate kinase
LEKTFIMIKPDAVRRALVGEIIGRIEKRNLKITQLKMVQPSREMAEEHYAPHKGKDFYPPLIEFLIGGYVVAMEVQGDNAIAIMRQMIGALNPLEANPGTIRGDFTISTRENLIHGSDSQESADRELALWFG